MIQAKVIADSKHYTRVTTIEVTLHRFVLAELNTHRAFSRNSASSRAIPVAKQIERVRTNPAIPIEFGTNQKGMQAGRPLEGVELQAVKQLWLKAAQEACDSAEKLLDAGVHKQVTNRLLEPFMWHTVIITATEWQNFFDQRCSPLAQPEIRVAAEAIRDALNASTPRYLAFGDWHLPYVQDDEQDLNLYIKKKLSAARCARVSYLTHDGVRDIDKDIDLCDKLISADPPHWSPLEHPCTPMKNSLGNLEGWSQLRHNQTDRYYSKQ